MDLRRLLAMFATSSTHGTLPNRDKPVGHPEYEKIVRHLFKAQYIREKRKHANLRRLAYRKGTLIQRKRLRD